MNYPGLALERPIFSFQRVVFGTSMKIEWRGARRGEDVLYIYVNYIHPELRIWNCRFRSGKGAKPIWRENRESTREHRGSKREHRGSRWKH